MYAEMADSAGGVRPQIQTMMAKGIKNNPEATQENVDSTNVKIRKEFPETFIFSSFDEIGLVFNVLNV